MPTLSEFFRNCVVIRTPLQAAVVAAFIALASKWLAHFLGGLGLVPLYAGCGFVIWLMIRQEQRRRTSHALAPYTFADVWHDFGWIAWVFAAWATLCGILYLTIGLSPP
jgi:hypothetical protein